MDGLAPDNAAQRDRRVIGLAALLGGIERGSRSPPEFPGAPGTVITSWVTPAAFNSATAPSSSASWMSS